MNTPPHTPSPERASPLRAWLATLSARYDSALLRDAPGDGNAPATPDARTAALRAWCERGSGDGRAPLWRPWALPELPEPLALAQWAPSAAPPTPVELLALLRQLDRNHELASLSRAAGLRLKLAVKARELAWWRARPTQQPWDTGYLRSGPEALARLASFRPRRPTLVLVQGLPAASLERALETLQAVRAHYRHPVRVLLLDAPPGAWAASATVLGAD